ncbi:cGMP-stimulated cGMP phosphodiesterase [Heterostelium album PN500]|uniref:cGMP-stimulated cGMP phosphodiesterase n=1 Tax=Heterostelium pallidum (strain ATCC 26659 / Pp 5 / PN500) TaxID=670386 RepID=D3AYU1_HETP5|nr:cGMP-stimulated cGMP phosphodiesterase [Heterostelium album PN500]EFA85631.1 cGMP-stimulated cGMP phosphodiesterase [Heterostelium album PN500]|eukprot:XP_020437738.1 cGMP-stimulated cGMP phosphodiesterase [Heterostelium album PN500]
MSHSPISSPSIQSPHGGHMMSPQHSHHSSSPPHHSQSPSVAESELEEKRFISSLFSFMTYRGTPIEKIPIFDHKELNLHKLYTCVITRGGLEAVIENKLWRQITTDLAVDPERTDAGFRLRIHYLKYLYPYERKYFLKMDDDERFDYEAFEKHLSKSPSDKKGASSRKKKFQNAIMSPQTSSTSPNSGKSTPSPTSSPSTLLVSALPPQNTNIPQINHHQQQSSSSSSSSSLSQQQNHHYSQSSQQQSHYQTQIESPLNNYNSNNNNINLINNNNQQNHYSVNTAPESPLSSSSSSTSQFFTSAILNNSSSNLAHPVSTPTQELDQLRKFKLSRRIILLKSIHHENKQQQQQQQQIKLVARSSFSVIHPVRFGVPPETIKDSMAMKIDVPTIYVFPEDLWDRRTGINAAEAEFPASTEKQQQQPEESSEHLLSYLPSKISFPDVANTIAATNDVFDPPTFGITIIGSSHGFDPKKSTTGFVLWVNKRGIMVDPPLNSSNFLLNQGVPTRRIDHIVLTHCHADHDSGTFQKLLEEYQITVVTTPTILNSFLRKYSALSNLNQELLRRLFIFRPVIIGEPMTIAVTIDKYYSGDTCFDPSRIKEMNCQNIMNTQRMNFFLKPWNHTVVLHEAGVPPIHTPVSVLASLSPEIKNRLYLVHISEHSLPTSSGLKIAREGVNHTLRLDVEKQTHSEAVDILKLMESVDIFRSIPLSQVAEILRTANRKTYPQGSVIIAQHTEPDAFFVVASGIVKVSVADLEKNLIAGDYFGEMSLIMGGLRSAKVSAVTDVEVLVFSKEDFLSITRNSTESINFVTRLWEMRNEKSWETINLNSVLNRCTNSQKTALQTILHREQLTENTILWKKGDVASFGCLVAEGSFEFCEQDLERFTKGSFLGDINAMSEEPPLTHKTTVIAKENSVIYKVYSSDLIKFFQHNPGLQLSFLDTMFVDAFRDQPLVFNSINERLIY